MCACSRSDLGDAPLPDDYREQFNEWQQSRMESLTNPTGWMRLAGMYWLEEGENRFGTDDQTDITFPEGTKPGYAGEFILADGKVTLQATEGVEFIHEGGALSKKKFLMAKKPFPFNMDLSNG